MVWSARVGYGPGPVGLREARSGRVRFGLVRYDAAWHGPFRCGDGVVRYGRVRRGKARSGRVWNGVVWYGSLLQST